MSVTFHIAHGDDGELIALTVEAAPSLNVNNAGAAELLALLNVPFDWAGEIEPHTVLTRLDAGGVPADPITDARLDALRAIAGAAARIGRRVAWD